MLTIIFSAKFPLEKEGGLYQNKVNFSLTFTQRLGYLLYPTTAKWSIPNENAKKE